MGKHSSTTWKSCGLSAFTVIIEISALVSISNFIVGDGVFHYLRSHVSPALYNLKVYSPPIVPIIVRHYFLFLLNVLLVNWLYPKLLSLMKVLFVFLRELVLLFLSHMFEMFSFRDDCCDTCFGDDSVNCCYNVGVDVLRLCYDYNHIVTICNYMYM
uniref:Uncharacterized protein n=1 Tax=Glossina austeni TaxID=7395 RepID=A0A1A9UMB7_GLOAU